MQLAVFDQEDSGAHQMGFNSVSGVFVTNMMSTG